MFWENKVKSTPFDVPDYMVHPAQWSDDEVSYAWLGHASVLINFYGTLIVTDPVLLDRIAPPELFDNFFGIRRTKQLPMELKDFSAVDVALVSHPHFDHLDLASLNLLNEKAAFRLIVPALTKDLIDDEKQNVIELDWQARAENSTVISDIMFSAFRVEHYGYADWGARDVKRGFNGYLMKSEKTANRESKTMAFFGDTSYSRYRDENGEVLDKPLSIKWRTKFDAEVLRSGIDLCIIPIGESYYYWNHISPKNAVKLAHELNCKKMLPIHYSTFILTPPEHEPVKPKQQLLQVLKQAGELNLIECRSGAGDNAFPEVGRSCILP